MCSLCRGFGWVRRLDRTTMQSQDRCPNGCEDREPRKRPDLPFGGGRVRPSEAAQALFAHIPCAICDAGNLPYLTNHASELYWQHLARVGRGRSGCPRFTHSKHIGGRMRDGSLEMPHE